jgi:UDP:flavonoid glycosyltransferase YjiC (YdhE family)
MRILFGFAGGTGHFNPLVPLARAAAAAGHVVAFTSRPRMVPTVEAAGFTALPVGVDSGSVPARIPLRPLDMAREERDFRENFAGWIARQRAAGVLERGTAWRPDLVVCADADFGSMIAAERLGLPYATLLAIIAGSFARPELVAEPLDELRAEYGLPPDPDLAMPHRYLVFSPVPARYRDPEYPLPATAYPLRPFTVDRTDRGPDSRQHDRPAVYFTLGTEFNVESGDLFQRVIEGLRELPIDLVVTVGHHIDPDEFGAQPANVRIERYIAQTEILPYCAAIVSHGGSGSVIGALAYGLPMVLIPLGADQPHNAARCAELGLARVLDAVLATPESVREAVSAVLADPAYRDNARRMADEIAAFPSPADAIAVLEQLTTRNSGRARENPAPAR